MFFFLLCVLEVFEQLGACCHLLYWTGFICKCAWGQNEVTNAKADQRGKGEGGAIVLGHAM